MHYMRQFFRRLVERSRRLVRLPRPGRRPLLSDKSAAPKPGLASLASDGDVLFRVAWRVLQYSVGYALAR